MTEPVDFDSPSGIQKLRDRARQQGKNAAVVCKDYFAFSRDAFPEIPPFIVGRGNWDNWMVFHARKSSYSVIDLSPSVTVVHQNHGYEHVSGGRFKTYVSGDEARQNRDLAGGSHLISGSATNFVLGQNRLQKVRLPWLNLRFWRDLPSFVRLVRNLIAGPR